MQPIARQGGGSGGGGSGGGGGSSGGVAHGNNGGMRRMGASHGSGVSKPGRSAFNQVRYSHFSIGFVGLCMRCAVRSPAYGKVQVGWLGTSEPQSLSMVLDS